MDFISIFNYMYTVFSISDLCGLIPHQPVNILAIKRQTIEIVMTTTVLAILFVRFFLLFFLFSVFIFTVISVILCIFSQYMHKHTVQWFASKRPNQVSIMLSRQESVLTFEKKIRGRARSFQIIWKQWSKHRFITCVLRLHIPPQTNWNGELVFRVKCVARRNKWICWWWQYTMHSTVNNND